MIARFFFLFLFGIVFLTLFFFFKNASYAAKTSADLLAEINQFRASYGLPSVKSNPLVCTFSATRAREITKDFSHDGFSERVNKKSMPYPPYKLVIENLARTKRENAVELWTKSPAHAANLLKDIQFVCVERYGYYYAFEGLTI